MDLAFFQRVNQAYLDRKHYDDQTDMYNKGEFKPFRFSYDALDKAKSSKMIFQSK